MPRAGLSTAAVTAAAADVADVDGFDALSLTAVAERVGVAVPSLYKHVDGLEDLRRRVAVLGVEELAALLEAAVAEGPADGPGAPGPQGTTSALARLAHAYRDFARRRPGRYSAGLRAPTGDDAEHSAATHRALACVLTVLEDHGLQGTEAVHAARSLRAALHGFVTLEAAGGFGLPEDVSVSFERLVGGVERLVSTWPAS